MKKYLKAFVFILIAQSAGLIGSLFTINNIETWYLGLNKPSLTPPNWLFGPAWLTLYTLMGVSVFLIWQKRDRIPKAKKAVILFFVHLFFNAIWSILFFGFHLILIGLVDIIIVWLFIVVLIVKFYPINKWSSYLLLPYLLWVSFATYLNAGILLLN